jgi:hypothetical protein
VLLELFFGKKPLFSEYLKVDKVRVSRYRRGRLIGTVTVGGGIERKHLPALGLCVGEKVDKVVCALTE